MKLRLPREPSETGVSPVVAVILVVMVTVILAAVIFALVFGISDGSLGVSKSPDSSAKLEYYDTGRFVIQSHQGSVELTQLGGVLRVGPESVQLSSFDTSSWGYTPTGEETLLLNTKFTGSGIGDGTFDAGDTIVFWLNPDEVNRHDATFTLVNSNTGSNPILVHDLTPQPTASPVRVNGDRLIIDNRGFDGITLSGVTIEITVENVLTHIEMDGTGSFVILDGSDIFLNYTYDGAGVADGTYDAGDSLSFYVSEEVSTAAGTGSSTQDGDTSGGGDGDTSGVSVRLYTDDGTTLVNNDADDTTPSTTEDSSSGSSDSPSEVSNDDRPETDDWSVDAGGDVTMNLSDELQAKAVLTNLSTGNVDHYEWYLGDGTVYQSQSISHRYASAGTYELNVIVEDTDGYVARDSLIVTVTEEGTQTVTTALQQAIDDAEPGDTLLIKSGTYPGVEFRTDDLTVITEGDVQIGSSTVTKETHLVGIDFTGRLSIKADGSGLYDSTVRDGSDWGVAVNAHDVTIRNTAIEAQDGLVVQKSIDNTFVSQTTVTANNRGVYMNGHCCNAISGPVFQNVDVTAGGFGFRAKSANNLIFDGVTVDSSGNSFELQTQSVAFRNENTIISGSNTVSSVSRSFRPGDVVSFSRSAITVNEDEAVIHLPTTDEYSGTLDLYGSGWTGSPTEPLEFDRLRVRGDGTTLTGVSIENPDNWGIVVAAHDVTIADAEVTALRGVRVAQDMDRATIRDSTIVADEDGIDIDARCCSHTSGATLQNLDITAGQAAVRADDVHARGLTLADVTLDSSSRVMHFDAQTVTFEGDIIVEHGTHAIESYSQSFESGETVLLQSDRVTPSDGESVLYLPTSGAYSTPMNLRGTGYTISTEEGLLLNRVNFRGNGITAVDFAIDAPSNWGVGIFANDVTLQRASITAQNGLVIGQNRDRTAVIDSTLVADVTGVEMNARCCNQDTDGLILQNIDITSGGTAIRASQPQAKHITIADVTIDAGGRMADIATNTISYQGTIDVQRGSHAISQYSRSFKSGDSITLESDRVTRESGESVLLLPAEADYTSSPLSLLGRDYTITMESGLSVNRVNFNGEGITATGFTFNAPTNWAAGVYAHDVTITDSEMTAQDGVYIGKNIDRTTVKDSTLTVVGTAVRLRSRCCSNNVNDALLQNLDITADTRGIYAEGGQVRNLRIEYNTVDAPTPYEINTGSYTCTGNTPVCPPA